MEFTINKPISRIFWKIEKFKNLQNTYNVEKYKMYPK